MRSRSEHLSIFLKEFFTIALPIMLGNLFTFGISFADHFMTSGLGSDASTGIFLSNQVAVLLTFLITGMEAGVAIVGSQALGEGDREGFGKTLSAVLYLTLAISITVGAISALFPRSVLGIFSNNGKITDTGADFLRIIAISFPIYSTTRVLIAAAKALGAPSLSLIAPSAALISNVVLNLVLIDGPIKLGAVGAGYSTLISRCIELCTAVLFISRSKKAKLHIKELFVTSKNAIRVLKNSLTPIIIGQLAWAGSNLFSTSVMSRSGAITAHAYAVTTSLMNLAYTVMNGASSAVGIMISREVGRNNAVSEGNTVRVGNVKDGRSKEINGSGIQMQNVAGSDSIAAKNGKRGAGPEHSMSLERIASVSERIFLSVGILSFIVIMLLGEPFITLYRMDAPSAELTRRLIPILALTFIATSYSAPALFGIIKSGGAVGFVTLVDIGALSLCTLPLTLLLSRVGAPPEMLYLALRLEHVVKCPIAYARIRRRDWAKRLTTGS